MCKGNQFHVVMWWYKNKIVQKMLQLTTTEVDYSRIIYRIILRFKVLTAAKMSIVVLRLQSDRCFQSEVTVTYKKSSF
jgi:hypothetical protein